MLRPLPLVLLALAASAPAASQPAALGDSAGGGWTSYIPYSTRVPPSAAERAVVETVRRGGVHVVHFWAPWCGNSQAAFETGWHEVVERHPEVSFTFVTVRNDGDDGAEALRHYGIPETAAVLAHDALPQEDVVFLGRAITWTPTTWVFNWGGRLAYAFHYGEVSAEMLETAIEHAQSTWEHD
jgi:thiol-disulfide isomerase/thioredoxin